jgi:two-component system OmpR family sensor kinase/two-component system sensor histidine kinase BaeS
MRGRFFRRIGCLFFLFVFFLLGMGVLFVWLVLQLLSLLQAPAQIYGWVIPLSVLSFVLGLAFLGWVGRRLRRLSMPVGDLLEASDRVASGDYSARVREAGPQEVRTLAHAFNSMAERLQTADEQRRSLLADVTHELRTPLTVIQGNLEGMLDGVYPADPRRLGSLLDETRLLSRRIDDLRTLAQVESQAFQLHKEPTDLGLLLNEIAAEFRGQAEVAGVRLQVEVAPELPQLELDAGRLRQGLSNLVANALRYSPVGGSVRLVSRLEPEGVTLEVQDDGPGIAAEDLPHVFERFYKGRDSVGMGLGLSIAKQIVAANGGEIAAISQPAGGTTMRIRLPAP